MVLSLRTNGAEHQHNEKKIVKSFYQSLTIAYKT